MIFGGNTPIQAKSLISESNQQLSEIERLYETCLNIQEIDNSLLIKIKNYLENLRSSLEYCAQGLNSKYGTQTDISKVSFPYAKVTVSKEQFIQNTYIDNKLPGVANNQPEVAAFITAMQHFSAPRCKWFPAFIQLTNTNKHVELTPHKKVSGEKLRLPNGLTIIAKSITDAGSVPADTTKKYCDEFLIEGVN